MPDGNQQHDQDRKDDLGVSRPVGADEEAEAHQQHHQELRDLD